MIDELYHEEVRAAREMSPGRKLILGIELFDWACKWMEGGIRLQHPDVDENRVRDLIRERLALAERMENAS